MNQEKEQKIRQMVDKSMRVFFKKYGSRLAAEAKTGKGTINDKAKNWMIAALGGDFMFYSAFVRSFDSSFGRVVENLGMSIAGISYETKKDPIDSFLLTEQSQRITYLLDSYKKGDDKPNESDYDSFHAMMPKNISSFMGKHVVDNWIYDNETNTHYLIELKTGGDLDNKKARSEKEELLKEYFMLENFLVSNGIIADVKIRFATAYNKEGEGNKWNQSSVKTFFAVEELLIGKDYWNFVCKDEHGFEVVVDQYRKSKAYIQDVIDDVRKAYKII